MESVGAGFKEACCMPLQQVALLVEIPTVIIMPATSHVSLGLVTHANTSMLGPITKHSPVPAPTPPYTIYQ